MTSATVTSPKPSARDAISLARGSTEPVLAASSTSCWSSSRDSRASVNVVPVTVVTGALSRLDVEGGFVAIGHHPATELFRGHLELDSDQYIKVATGTTRTSVPGVFVAGDVRAQSVKNWVWLILQHSAMAKKAWLW